MSKRNILTILFLIIVLFTGLVFLRQVITNRIQKKVIENTMFTDNPEVIKKEIERLDIAIKLNPKKYLYHATRAQLHCKMKQFETAISDLDRIYKFKKDYAEGYFYQGTIYDWISKTDTALIYYEKAESIYNRRINEETNIDLINAHKYNIFVLKLLQNDSVSLLDYESDTLSIRFESMKIMKQKSRSELLSDMFDS